MNLRNIVTGAFVGTIVMNILMPFILTKDATNKDILFLYTLPLVGALSSFVLEIEKLEMRNGSKTRAYGESRRGFIGDINKLDISNFFGRDIRIRTYGGALISGILKGMEDNLLILISAKRLDIPDSISSSIIFIDKKDVREIELLNESINSI